MNNLQTYRNIISMSITIIGLILSIFFKPSYPIQFRSIYLPLEKNLTKVSIDTLKVEELNEHYNVNFQDNYKTMGNLMLISSLSNDFQFDKHNLFHKAKKFAAGIGGKLVIIDSIQPQSWFNTDKKIITLHAVILTERN